MDEQTKDFADDVNTTHMEKLGHEVYGENWPQVRALNVRRMKGDDQSPLGQTECNLLINGLRKLAAMKRR